ncbi:MAG: MarR family transcriptional regulator [Spongiibacteraceae bacterium]
MTTIFEAMEDNIGSMLADTSRLIRRAFDERARGIGVTRPQWQLLTTLRRNEGTNQGNLAELLDTEPITLCRMVDRMQEADLIERRQDPSDRRVWRLFLTDKARRLLEDLQPLGREVMALALDGMTQAERDELRRLLDRIRQNLARRPNTSS